ncbi:hypothetical protein PRIPAC_81176, partial [Pristionchus pacificus]
ASNYDKYCQIPSIAWARNQTANFLVLGRRYGDIGLFDREMYLLLFSIIVCFSFYVCITYHAVFVIGKETACFTSLFFILPLTVFFLIMATPAAIMVPISVLQPARFILVIVFGCCSFGHSVVFLFKSAWVIQFGLEWDRDQLLHLAAGTRRVYWPISVFLILPIVLFVLIRRTHMDRDCKIAFVAHNVILAIFDVYNGLFYQMYTLLPYPVFCCTGILCDEHTSPRALLTILSFWTIAICVPYLFVMIRMHQKMLIDNSPLKLSYRSQALLMFIFSAVLVSNVYGFGAWSVESAEKAQILKFRTLHKSRTYQIQVKNSLMILNNNYSKALFTSVLFILPLVALFIFLVTPLGKILPGVLLGPLRVTLMVMYSCSSIGHSLVFLFK